MQDSKKFLYAGISGARIGIDSFDLGKNLLLRRTFAHLFSAPMMAFSPPGPEGFHPAPWKAAKGGFSFDIELELRVPEETSLGPDFDAREIAWLIVALFRLSRVPQLCIPILSDRSFDSIPKTKGEPSLAPFEIEARWNRSADDEAQFLDMENLEWVKRNWLAAGNLMISNSKVRTAVRAFDYATLRGRTSASLLALWGALEQLFSPSRAELRYRVSSFLASYMQPPGADRLQLYKQVLKLYDQRSTAAHTASDVDIGPMLDTYVLMRNALMRIIDEKKAPTQDDLEGLLFGSNEHTRC